jgi:hypothetical protein
MIESEAKVHSCSRLNWLSLNFCLELLHCLVLNCLYSGFALEWKRIWLFQSRRGELYGGKKDQEACYLDTDFGRILS